MRDALLDYVELLRTDALAQFRHEQTLFVLGGLKQAPTLPPILAGQSTAHQSPVVQHIGAREVVNHV
jgi:hypothetical protein